MLGSRFGLVVLLSITYSFETNVFLLLAGVPGARGPSGSKGLKGDQGMIGPKGGQGKIGGNGYDVSIFLMVHIFSNT